MWVFAEAIDLMRVSLEPNKDVRTIGGVFGVDVTVQRPVKVLSLGVLDAGAPGLSRDVLALIIDRETLVAVANVTLLRSERRDNDTRPFVLRPVNVVLQKRAYSVVTVGFDDEPAMSTAFGDVVSATDSNSLLVTAGTFVDNGSFVVDRSLVHLGATFSFAPIDADAPQNGFRDCEAVACQGLPSGRYAVGDGSLRYCDNDAAGGGWTRLWSLADSTCETFGWTSSRSIISGQLADPFGCRPQTIGGAPALVAESPFAFAEVRGSNFRIFGAGSLDAFGFGAHPDGVLVKDEADETIWLFSVGSSIESFTRCPCDAMFKNDTMSVRNLARFPFHSCSTITYKDGAGWSELFLNTTAQPGCETFDPPFFQRTLPAPRSALFVQLFKDHAELDEDLKLVTAELFVRRTAGFSRAMCPPTTTTTAATAATTTTTSSTLASLAAPVALAAADLSGVLIGVASALGGVLALVSTALLCVLLRAKRNDNSSEPLRDASLDDMRSARDEGASARSPAALYGSVGSVAQFSSVASQSSASPEYVVVPAARTIYDEGRIF